MTIKNYRIFNPIFDEDFIDKLDVQLLDEDYIEEDALTPSEQLEINRGLAQWIK
jgi:hypothetical protein